MAVVALIACTSSPSTHKERAPAPGAKKKLIVLGIDGMDPVLLKQYMDQGLTPNLKKLAESGGFMDLGTSTPPQSPVAWSNFITGHDSEHHGIFDFVHRNPESMAPYLSTSEAKGPSKVLKLGSLHIPLESGGVELLREGLAFWELLEAHSVKATVFKIPANFPPHEQWKTKTLAGMGTPDLLGTYGTFHFLTDDPERKDKKASGGIIVPLDFADGKVARAVLTGPPDPFAPPGTSLTLPVEVRADRERGVVLLRLDDTPMILNAGEWTDWIPVSFGAVPGVIEVSGMVRVFVKSLNPHVSIYVSPINIDPEDPMMPISSPREFAGEVAQKTGRYYTQGMPEDTKALAADALSDEEFLQQARYIYEERERLLRAELEEFDEGLLFFYFSSVDQVCHVFFRSIHPEASEEDKAYAGVIPEFYQKADKAVGLAMEKAGDDTALIVMSDHGFGHYRRKVHLNTWLVEKGYLVLTKEGKRGEGPLGHFDWEQTQAYALGLNQLFLNLKGREKTGIVPEEEKELLLRRLDRELRGMKDPETGARVISRTFRPKTGAFSERTPDLIIGYNKNYRSSDTSAMGQITEEYVEDNKDKWSGDHCVDPAHVPGILVANRKLGVEKATLIDMAPSILHYFGVTLPKSMSERNLVLGTQEKK